MKKIITGIVIIGIILGLGFGGYWLYRKFVNPDIALELEKIEINPDERNGITDNLVTKDEKIEMIIQLIEDMNAHKISYNYTYKNLGREGRFYVGDKYEIDFILNPLVKGKDYMGRTYVSGTINTYTLFINGSKTVHQWMELTKETIYKSDKEIEVDLAYEDEVLYGKHDMRYKSTPESEYEDLVENLKKYRSYLELSETDGVYKLIHEGLYIRIETDGITYIDISLSSDSNNHYELNNKELYEKIVASIKGIKNFPIVTNTEEQPSEKSIRLQSKYDHKKLMADYIASIEPKNQTWNVEDIQDFYFSEGFLYTNFYGKITIGNDFYMSGFLSSSNASQNLQSSIEIIFKESYIHDILENGVRTIEIKVDKNGVATVSKGTLNDYLFELIIKIESDDSFTVNYRTHLDLICDNERIIKDCLITETGKFINEKIDKTTLICNSKLTLNSYSFIDSNNNEYLLLGEKTYEQSEEYSLLTTFVDYYLFK